MVSERGRTMGKDVIEVLIFYGEDPESWVAWIDEFVSGQEFSDFQTRQFAYGFIEGEAHTWYCDELSRSVFWSWEDLKTRLLHRFGKRVEVVKKEEPSFMDRMEQLSRLLDRLDKRRIEEDDAKIQREEKNDLPFRKIEIPQLVSKPAVAESVQEVAEEEDLLISLEKDDLFVVTENDEQMEHEGKIIERYEPAHQLFVKMTVRRKGNVKKKKKKRWKKLYPDTEEYLGENLSLEGKDSLELLGIQMENTTNSARKSLLEWCKGLNCQWVHPRQVCGKKWLLMFRTKKRKSKKQKEMAEKSYKPYRRTEQCKKSERAMLGNMTRGLQCHMMKVSAEKVNKEVCVEMKLHHSQLFNKRLLLLIVTKKKKRTRMDNHERRSLKPNKEGDHSGSLRETKRENETKGIMHELESVKLRQERKTVLKKLERWMKHKFKQKHIKQRDKTKLDGLVRVLTAKMRKRTKSEYQVVHGKLLSFVSEEHTNLLMEWKKYKDRYKHVSCGFSMKHAAFLENFIPKLKNTKKQLWKWRKKKLYLTSRKRAKFRKYKKKKEFCVVKKEKCAKLFFELRLSRLQTKKNTERRMKLKCHWLNLRGHLIKVKNEGGKLLYCYWSGFGAKEATIAMKKKEGILRPEIQFVGQENTKEILIKLSLPRVTRKREKAYTPSKKKKHSSITLKLSEYFFYISHGNNRGGILPVETYLQEEATVLRIFEQGAEGEQVTKKQDTSRKMMRTESGHSLWVIKRKCSHRGRTLVSERLRNSCRKDSEKLSLQNLTKSATELKKVMRGKHKNKGLVVKKLLAPEMSEVKIHGDYTCSIMVAAGSSHGIVDNLLSFVRAVAGKLGMCYQKPWSRWVVEHKALLGSCYNASEAG